MIDSADNLAGDSIASAQAQFARDHPEGSLLSKSQKKKAVLKRQLTAAADWACRAELDRDDALDSLKSESAERANCSERLDLRNKC